MGPLSEAKRPEDPLLPVGDRGVVAVQD
jgi:hypothetical protein